MRITGVRIFIVTIGGRHPVLVDVQTDAGLRGVGDAGLAYGTGATAAAGMAKDLAEGFLLEDRGDGRSLQRAHRAPQLREPGLDGRGRPGRRLHAERADPGAVPVPDPGAFEIVDCAPELEVRGGLLPVPSRPGLGVTLVEDEVRPFVWATCRR